MGKHGGVYRYGGGWEGASHFYPKRANREIQILILSFLILFKAGPQTLEWCHKNSGCVFLPMLNLSGNALTDTCQRCLLSKSKSTQKANNHTYILIQASQGLSNISPLLLLSRNFPIQLVTSLHSLKPLSLLTSVLFPPLPHVFPNATSPKCTNKLFQFFPIPMIMITNMTFKQVFTISFSHKY